MGKLKQKLLLFALLGTSTGGLVLSVVSPTLAEYSFGSVTLMILGFLPKLLFDLVMQILNLIFGIVAMIVTFSGQIILQIALNLDPNFLLNSVAAGNVWSKILTLTNGLYLLILIIASIAIILRVNVGVYNVKKILGGLVTAIALSNFSLLVVKVLVEFSAQITNSLTLLFGIGDYKKFLIALLWETQPLTYIAEGYISGLEVIIAWIIFFLVATIIIKLAIILLERMIWIFALTIVAPLAFAMGVLPNMQSYSKQWWEHLIKWVMVLPATIGITCLAIFVMTNGNSNSATTISKQVVGLSGLFRVNDASLITFDNNLIMMLAGIALLWFAGEAGKKMKLGTASGTVFKGISDTFTGKNAVGKFAKEGYYNTVYPEAVARSKRVREWEGKRLANVRGPVARIINPEGWKKVRKLDTQAHVDKATIGKQALNVKELATQKQGYENLKKEEASFLKQYSVNNGRLFDATGTAAPLLDQQRYNEVDRQISTGAAKYKTTNDKYKQEMAGLAWKVRDVNKSTTIDQIPDYDTLKADIKKAHDEDDLAKELSGFEQMSRIARTKNHPDSADAANFMGGPDAERMFEQIGINKEVFRSRVTPAQKLKSMRENAPKNAHRDLIVAQDDFQAKKIDFFSQNYDIAPPDTSITIMNNRLGQVEDLHQNITDQVGINDSDGDSLNELIMATEIARNSSNVNKGNDQAVVNAAIASAGIDRTHTNSVDRIKKINQLFNLKGANAEKIYTKINARATVNNVADLISELDVIKQDVLKVNDAGQKVDIINGDIQTDYKSHKDNYEFFIRNKINAQVEANQATDNPTTNTEVIQQRVDAHRIANNSLDTALKQFSGEENAKTKLNTLSQQPGSNVLSLSQIKQELEKDGIPGPITQNGWDDLTLEDVKKLEGRTMHVLSNLNQPPKGGQQT